MRIEHINSQISFGIYKQTKPTSYGKRISGLYKDYEIDVYIAEKAGKLQHKLYYVRKCGEWLKSKLVYFENGIKSKVVHSQNTIRREQ